MTLTTSTSAPNFGIRWTCVNEDAGRVSCLDRRSYYVMEAAIGFASALVDDYGDGFEIVALSQRGQEILDARRAIRSFELDDELPF